MKSTLLNYELLFEQINNDYANSTFDLILEYATYRENVLVVSVQSKEKDTGAIVSVPFRYETGEKLIITELFLRKFTDEEKFAISLFVLNSVLELHGLCLSR